MKIRLFVLLCVCLFSVNTFAAQSKTPYPIVLSLPQLNWALEINAPGFSMEDYEIAPHGQATRFQASNKETGIMMSGFLEKAPQKGGSEECRTYYWTRAKASPYPKMNIKMSQSGDMAIVEYLVKKYMGREVNQQNVNAYLAESDYCIDIHLSKLNYTPEDQKHFKAILSGVKIRKDYKPDSLMLSSYGDLFYWQKKYSKAISYYQQALILENNNRTMPKAFWLVLVDRLGMSYGFFGNMEKAKEIYNDAILKEPEYPMFYYNLACAYAETNNLDEAMMNLNLAYKYRENMLFGKKLPDPRTDSSFKRYIGSEPFESALKKLK